MNPARRATAAEAAFSDSIVRNTRAAPSSNNQPVIRVTARVASPPEHRPDVEVTAELTMTLVEHGGTAGFHRNTPPPGYWVPPYYDVLILSIDNDMTETGHF